MKSCSLLILFILLSLPLYSEEKVNLKSGNFRIRNIYFRNLDVFDPVHKEFQSSLFRVANGLHVKTRKSFLRNELLLREGDVASRDLIRESERNLRRYAFLTDVSIDVLRVDQDEVDLYVNTEDQWTTTVDLSMGKTRGYRSFDIGFQEENFLGFGRRVGLKYERNNERDGVRGSFLDSHFLNTRLRFNLKFAHLSDGYRNLVVLDQPFYSRSARWSYGIAFDQLKKKQHFYYRGIDAAALELNQHLAHVRIARAWRKQDRRMLFGMSAGYGESLFPAIAEILDQNAGYQKEVQRNLNPEDRRTLNFGLHLDGEWQQHERFSYLDQFGKTEDLPIGFFGSVALTRSQNEIGADYVTGAISGRWTFQRSLSQFFVSQASFQVRRQSGTWNNMIADLSARYYFQTGKANFGFFKSPRQTFVLNVSTTLTRNVDLPFQLSLGEEEGLRGYTFRNFNGLNRALLNFEDRIFTPWQNRLLGIGFVSFLDAGHVWSKNSSSDSFGSSVGVGVRLAFKKFQRTKILRIDFAYPFVNAPSKRISISIKSGQFFNIL